MSILPTDLIMRIATFLPFETVCHFESVSKLWKSILENPYVWAIQSENKGVPLVEGKERDRKYDFRILYPICITIADIACLGKFGGKIPKITETDFNKLLENDPWQSHKQMFETFKVVIEPEYVEREAYKDENSENYSLNSVNNSQCISKKRIEVPFSLRNFNSLVDFPLKTGNIEAVFYQFCAKNMKNYEEITSKVNIFFVRDEVIDESLDFEIEAKKNLVEKLGFQLPPARVRALQDAVTFINTGECSDFSNLESVFALTSDYENVNGTESPIIVGDFMPQEDAEEGSMAGGYFGVKNAQTSVNEIGVAPCWPSGHFDKKTEE